MIVRTIKRKKYQLAPTEELLPSKREIEDGDSEFVYNEEVVELEEINDVNKNLINKEAL